MTLRVLIADDHDLMRRGLRTLVEGHANWSVCGEARTGREAIELAKKLHPDVAVLDMTMPDLNGLEAAKRIMTAENKIEILMLSVHYSDQLVREILASGIRSYILKTDSDRDLIRAIEALACHKPFFTPRATEVVLKGFTGRKSDEKYESAEAPLSSREREVLQLLAESKSSKEVAQVLNISVKTAETHRSNIMKKLNVHNVSDLVRYAVRNLITEP